MISPLLTSLFLVSQALAAVNGKPITREDLEASLSPGARQEYHDAVSDLSDYEHASVRDYLGRQAVERAAQEQNVPTDSIYARAMASEFGKFDPNLRNRIQQQRERVFEIERAAIEDLIQRKLFETAARAKGMTAEELARSLPSRVAPVTKSDLDFIKAYEASKQQATATVAPGEPRLEAAIRSARAEQLRLSTIDSMHGLAKIKSYLVPPRVVVSTANASLVGSASAPVHIVVFTDFDCPYCREGEQALSRIRQQYGDRVALYYLNYPLPNHPNAQPAARAAVCAAAMGRYSAYHDLLFAHQEELAHADYAGWAKVAGLDRAAFEKCRLSDGTQRRVEQDIREGIAAGVSGTPTYLVNGRLVRDNQELPGIVEEELAASR